MLVSYMNFLGWSKSKLSAFCFMGEMEGLLLMAVTWHFDLLLLVQKSLKTAEMLPKEIFKLGSYD